MTHEEQTLLSCPFCGGEASSEFWRSAGPTFTIFCDTCHASAETCSSLETARETWNTRPTPDGLVETGWQPIETAPKDGTRIDLWVVRLSSSGKSHDEHRAPEAYWNERLGRWRCKWKTANDYPAIERHYTPTHWQPLPAPPALASIPRMREEGR